LSLDTMDKDGGGRGGRGPSFL